MPLLGTPVDSIDLAEDRARFGGLMRELGLKSPPYATATSPGEALERAADVGYPLLVRPSYVLGGRAMEICYSHEKLADYLKRTRAHAGAEIYLDRFLENSIEIDVDALCDGESVQIGAIMQHVEEAGVHSGDSACVIPAMSLGPEMLDQVQEATEKLALRLGVVGLINIQFAVSSDEDLFVIEANPRASRTVPFVSKAVGVPLAKVACRLMLGERLADMDLPLSRLGAGNLKHVSVKEAVLPFDRFPRADALLGPGDEVDRRGDGGRRRLPGGVRQGAGGRRRSAPGRGRRLHLGDRHGQAGSDSACGRRFTTSASASTRPAAPRARSAAWACRSSGSRRSARARRTSWTTSTPAKSTSSSTRRPARARARTGGRSGAPPWDGESRASRPSRPPSAAQRAILARRKGEVEVRSLQELHGLARVT